MNNCCIDVSRGTAYGLCISQILFTIACILYSPHREIVVYTLKNPTNTTTLERVETHVHVQWTFACLSFLAFFFSSQTMHYNDVEVAMSDFNVDFIENNVMWDFMFWVYGLGSHFLLVGIIMQISDVYCLVFCSVLLTYSLYKLCYPRSHQLNMTRENIFMLGYILGIYLVFINSQKPDLIVWIVILDYCLGLGHVWDKNATTVDTIINCRLFYICCQSLLLCVYYGWQ